MLFGRTCKKEIHLTLAKVVSVNAPRGMIGSHIRIVRYVHGNLVASQRVLLCYPCSLLIRIKGGVPF